MLILALKNLRRRPLRTALTVSGVALAVAVLYSLSAFQAGYQERLRAELAGLGAHILVVPKGCPYEAASIAIHGANWPRYLRQADLPLLAATPGVRHAAGVLMSATTDPRTAQQQIWLGVDPEIRAVKPFWQIVGRFPSAPDEALIGSEVARRRGLRPGDRFVDGPRADGRVSGQKPGAPIEGVTRLRGFGLAQAPEAVQARHSRSSREPIPSRHVTALPGAPSFRVAGVIARTGGQDDSFIYIPRATAQRLFRHPGQLTNVLVTVDDPERVLPIAAAMRRREPDVNVVPMAQVLQTMLDLARTTRLLVTCVVLIALLISVFGVVNTVMSSVFERTGEIGMLRAVGASRAEIFRLVWIETVWVCVLGGAAGNGLALIGARLVEAIVRAQLPYAPQGTLIAPDAPLFAGCVAGAAVLGALAGLLPAARACALRPVEAIRAGR
jgi:putative ABC transport system permease protein